MFCFFLLHKETNQGHFFPNFSLPLTSFCSSFVLSYNLIVFLCFFLFFLQAVFLCVAPNLSLGFFFFFYHLLGSHTFTVRALLSCHCFLHLLLVCDPSRSPSESRYTPTRYISDTERRADVCVRYKSSLCDITLPQSQSYPVNKQLLSS